MEEGILSFTLSTGDRMRWDQTEFLLKGLYLGLLLLVGLQNPTGEDLIRIALCTLVGLILALAAAAFHKIREGYRVRGRLAGFILFLLLENPGNVYLGVIGGFMIGAYPLLRQQPHEWTFWGPLLGGVVLGLVFYIIRNIADRKLRNWLGFALAVLLIGGPVAYFWFFPLPLDQLYLLGILVLMGLPGFYLLTFASLVEESEVEIAAICGALGLGLWILSRFYMPNLVALPIVLPLVLYYLYSRRILPGLRVFKHTLRGLTYKEMGQYRLALASLNRALQLNPQYRLARQQLWDLHRHLTLDHLKEDPSIVPMVNYSFCLERVSQLLLQPKPEPKHLEEALKLLEFVATQRPELEPACQYWRAVAYCHLKNFDEAAQNLESLLAQQADSPARRSVLFQGWYLALTLHPEMKRRVGEPLLKYADRRFDAIVAVEREIARQGPQEQEALDLRPVLYSQLSETDYHVVVPPGQVLEDFNYLHVRELGLALLDHPGEWRRGCEFLRIAAQGLPNQAPILYIQMGKVHEKFGDLPGMWASYQKAMQLGRAIGAQNLAPEDRKQLFTTVKTIGERALAENQIDTALDAYKYLSQSEYAGVETWRALAELLERKGDVWTALHCTEHGLSYNDADADLLARKDRYYFSLSPADVKARWEQIYRWFDTDYCMTKVKKVLEKYDGNLDLLDWASHLANLALIAKPKDLTPRVLKARLHRLKGETNEAIALLEEIRQNRPEKFGGEQEEDSWYVAHRLLGDYYIDTKPDQAIACLQEFRKSSRAGADTAYKLGRAYENMGDLARAARCYDEVLMFPDHPLYYEARDGLDRVKRGGTPVR